LTFVVAETNDLGGYTILKQAESLMDLSKMDIDPGSFPAVFVARSDIVCALGGEDGDYEDDFEGTERTVEDKIIRKERNERVSKLTDKEMREIASDLQDAYVDGTYWDDLSNICEDLHDE